MRISGIVSANAQAEGGGGGVNANAQAEGGGGGVNAKANTKPKANNKPKAMAKVDSLKCLFYLYMINKVPMQQIGQFFPKINTRLNSSSSSSSSNKPNNSNSPRKLNNNLPPI